MPISLSERVTYLYGVLISTAEFLFVTRADLTDPIDPRCGSQASIQAENTASLEGDVRAGRSTEATALSVATAIERCWGSFGTTLISSTNGQTIGEPVRKL